MRWYQPKRTHPIRLEPMPWTGRRTWRKRLPEITATVVAKSPGGVMLEENGPWYNWSLPEYRGEPFNTGVQKGDRVQITYATKEYDDPAGGTVTKYFITTIDKVTGATAPQQALADDQPFPPDEPPDATESPSAPVLDKDRLIVRQVAAKCAVEALGDYPYMAPSEEKERWDGALLYLMSFIEDLVYRE